MRVPEKREKGSQEALAPDTERPLVAGIRARNRAQGVVLVLVLRGGKCLFKGDFQSVALPISLKNTTT